MACHPDRVRRNYDVVPVTLTDRHDRRTPRQVMHAPGRLDYATLSYPCSCGGRWYLDGPREPRHADRDES